MRSSVTPWVGPGILQLFWGFGKLSRIWKNNAEMVVEFPSYIGVGILQLVMRPPTTRNDVGGWS